jgi:hypothetical protein
MIGELAIFQTQAYFLEQKSDKADILSLSVVSCVTHGFNAELARKSINSIELSFLNDKLQLYLGCYDQDQLKKWLDCF